MPYEIYFLIAMSGLLIWAAVADWRTSKGGNGGVIPRPASYMLLLLAIAWLFVHGQWWEAVFLGIIVIRPAKKPWMYIAEISGFVLMALRGFTAEVIFFVVAVLVIQLLFDNKILKGGDAQVAVAVIAIIPEYWFFVMFTLIYAGVVSFLSVRRFGFKGSLKRLRLILSKDRKAIEEDNVKITTPWLVLVATCTMIYVWIYPGLLATIIGKL